MGEAVHRALDELGIHVAVAVDLGDQATVLRVDAKVSSPPGVFFFFF